MQVLQVDLRKNPELADLLVDMAPGDQVYLRTSIKSVDDQTVELTIERAQDDVEDLDKSDEPGEGETDDGENEDENQPVGGESDRRNPQGDRATKDRYSGNTAKVRGMEDAAQ